MMNCAVLDRSPPSMLPPSDDERVRAIAERMATDNQAVDEFMERLAKFIEDIGQSSKVQH